MGFLNKIFGSRSAPKKNDEGDLEDLVHAHEQEIEATPLEVAEAQRDDYKSIVEARDEDVKALNAKVEKLESDARNFQRVVAALEREASVTREKLSRFRQIEELVDAGAPGEDLYQRIKNTICSNEISGSSLANAHRALQDQFQGVAATIRAKDLECNALLAKLDAATGLVELERQQASRYRPVLSFLEGYGWREADGVAAALKLLGETFRRADHRYAKAVTEWKRVALRLQPATAVAAPRGKCCLSLKCQRDAPILGQAGMCETCLAEIVNAKMSLPETITAESLKKAGFENRMCPGCFEWKVVKNGTAVKCVQCGWVGDLS